MIYMACDCGMEMKRRIDGAWTKTCACKHRRYWASMSPLSKDAAAYRQLTGASIPRRQISEVDSLYRYGV